MWSQVVFVSATPGKYELEKTGGEVVEQVIRPTGLVDPEIVVHPAQGQVPHLLAQIKERAAQGERVLVTTLTKRLAEDLSAYIQEAGIRGRYLHSEIQTLERVEILSDLRKGDFDVLVGINLLREGLDLPEVSMVAILDADKAGFLRSETSLIQTIGRAARNVNAKVILYADTITPAMRKAIDETARRRQIQTAIQRRARHHAQDGGKSDPHRHRSGDESPPDGSRSHSRAGRAVRSDRIDPVVGRGDVGGGEEFGIRACRPVARQDERDQRRSDDQKRAKLGAGGDGIGSTHADLAAEERRPRKTRGKVTPSF